MPTIIPLPGSVDDAHTLAVVDAATKPRHTPRLQNWLRGSFAGKKVVCIGDSTTFGATSFFTRLQNYHTAPGGLLDGLSSGNIVNHGNNGSTLAAYLAATGNWSVGNPFWTLNDLVAAAPDLIVVSFLINDVRQGQTTENQAFALLSQLVATLRSLFPNADIVLRTPNALLTTDVGGTHYVKGSDGTINPAGAAQTYTDILWRTYRRAADLWPNALLVDAQTLVFGRTALAASAYMGDQLHPNAAGQNQLADLLASVIGYAEPFDAYAAIMARAQAVVDGVLTPWDYYAREVEDPLSYDLVASGDYQGKGDGFLDFALLSTYMTNIVGGDVVQMGHYAPFEIPTGVSKNPNGSYTRLSNLGSGIPANAMAAGLVRIWRPKYGDDKIEALAKQTVTYPYRRFGRVVSGGNGFVRIVAKPSEDRAAQYWHPAVADTLQIAGQSPVVLTGATFSANGANLQISVTGDYTAAVGKRCAVFGNHLYERGLSLTGTVDPPSLAAGATSDYFDVTVTGVQTSDTVTPIPPAALEVGLIVGACRVRIADRVSLRIANLSGSTIDGASLTWGFQVQR